MLKKKYIKIMFKQHDFSRKLQKKGNLIKSILLFEDKIFLRWELPIVNCNQKLSIVGIDTGINNVVTVSDGQQTTCNKHKHTLNSILKKIVQSEKTRYYQNKKRKLRGQKIVAIKSKGFHRARQHSINFVNWSVKQINLNNIKQINLEYVSNFRNKKKIGNFLNYSCESLIRKKLQYVAKELGVQVILQSSAYRSQRCSKCGYVCNNNRNKSKFLCKHKDCGYSNDADINASLNNLADIPQSWLLLQCLWRNKPFFWKKDGFFDVNNQELIVPDAKNNI